VHGQGNYSIIRGITKKKEMALQVEAGLFYAIPILFVLEN